MRAQRIRFTEEIEFIFLSSENVKETQIECQSILFPSVRSV